MSASVIGALRVNLGLDSANFVKGLTASQKRLRDFGKRMAVVGAGITAVGAGIVAGVRGQLNAADEMSKAASKIGIPTDELSRLKYAADMSGVSMGTLQSSVQRLSRVMAQTPDKLKKIGVAARDADGNMRSTSEVMADVAEVLAGMPDGAEKTALAMELMGRSGAEMIPMLNGGAKALRDLQAEADALGIVITPEMGKAAEAFNDNIARLGTQFRGLFTIIASELAPVLERFSAWLVEAAGAFRSLSPETRAWVAGIAGAVVVIGPLLSGLGLFLMTMGPVIGALKMAVAGFGLVAGAVKAVGLALTANPIGVAIMGIAAAAYAIYDNWGTVGPWFQRLWGNVRTYFGGFATFLKGVFTGDLTGAVDGLKQIWSGLSGFYQTLWDGVVGIFKWAWETGIKPVTDALGITAELEAGWRLFQSGIETVLSAIGSAFQSAWAYIQPVVDALKWVMDKGAAAMNSLPTIRAGEDPRNQKIGLAIREGSFLDRLRGGSSQKDVVDGARASIGEFEKVGADQAAAQNAGYRRGMGINSPSKVMAENGMFLSQGLAQGIEQYSRLPIEAMQGVADGVSGMAEQMKGSFQSAFEGLVMGTVSAKQAISSLLQDFAKMLANRAFQALWGGFGGGGGLSSIFAGFFDGGGRIPSGKFGIAGEYGPELVRGPAYVTSRADTARMMQGGGGTVRVIIEEAPGFAARVRTEAQGVAVDVVRAAGRSQSDAQYLGAGRR